VTFRFSQWVHLAQSSVFEANRSPFLILAT
jgi:hypothetical protein